MVMRASEVLACAIQQLGKAEVETPALDARLLLQQALECDRAALVREPHLLLSSDQCAHYASLVQRRCAHEPLSHILGQRAFWRDVFEVSSAVLDPRPDSETLIEALCDAMPQRDAPLRLLDLGTGSGCLLLSALREFPHAQGVGVDISEVAARTAQRNAQNFELEGRAKFIVGAWTDALQSSFDVIMSNPPYIVHDDIAGLAPEVREYEPHLALSGGADGLCAYRALMPQIALRLASGGIAVIELGFGQGSTVSDLAMLAGLKVQGIRNDLAGVPRALVLKAL